MPKRFGATGEPVFSYKAKDWNPDRKGFGATAEAGVWLCLGVHGEPADAESDDPAAHRSTCVQWTADTGAQTCYDPLWIKKHFGDDAWEPHPGHPPFYVLIPER